MTDGAKLGLAAVAAAAIGIPLLVSWSQPVEAASNVPPAAMVERSKAPREVAVLAGGCFWGVEAVFEHVKGVTNVRSGYAGGDPKSGNYAAVSGGRTRHAEAVRIAFDPRQVTYADLLRIYFSV